MSRRFSYRPPGQSRQPQPRFDVGFVNYQDPEEAYESARRQIAGLPNKNYQRRGRGSTSRKGYQSARVEEHRFTRSKITADDFAEELKKSLLPGVKTGQTAFERLEAVNTMKAITICITTRAIGFGTASIFLNLFQFEHVPERGNIYQLYRVSLAAVECQIQTTNRGIRMITEHEDDYADVHMTAEMTNAVKGFVAAPDQISLAINAIGAVKVGDVTYLPRIGKRNETRHGRFVPQSEQTSFSNLRETVVALADVATPANYRRSYYNNSPLPGAIWRGAPKYLLFYEQAN